jgi:type I restriction enzyme, S subunit
MKNTSQILESDRFHDLPKIWIYTTIDEITDFIQYGHTASAKKNKVGPKFLRITDIQDSSVNWSDVPYCEIPKSEIKKYLLESGDLVFARTGATVGKSYLIKENIPEAIFASYLIRLRISSLLNRKFVYYFFQSPMYWNQITTKKIGTGQPNVNGNLLKTIILPIAPSQEQNRIVAKLEELLSKLDAGIEAIKRTKKLLKQYRQSVLKYAFEGKLTEKWRHQNKLNTVEIILERINSERKKRKLSKLEFLHLDKLDKMPSSWKWVKLGEIYDVLMGQSPPGDSYNVKGDGMPLLNGPTEFGEKYPSPIQWTKKITKLSEKDDLLLCIRGNTTGRMNWSDQRYCIGRGLAALRPVISEINSKILYFFLIMKANELISKTTGSTFPNLKSNELNSFLFPLMPFDEQNKIGEEIEMKFSIMENTGKIIRENQKYCEMLRQSILKMAFEGKLVPQNPSDESASVLLEKIKQDKSNNENKRNSKINENKTDSKQMRLI